MVGSSKMNSTGLSDAVALAGVLAQAEEVGELDALALAAAEGAAALTESDVAQSHIVQRLETGRDTGGGRLAGSGEEVDGLVHAHVKHVADIFPTVLDFEHILDEALAAAGLAGHDDVGHELHGYLDCTPRRDIRDSGLRRC